MQPNNKQKPVFLVVGAIASGVAGGVEAGTYAVQRRLAEFDDLNIEFFRYGRIRDSESITRKICRTVIDLLRILPVLSKNRWDVVYLNSSFNRNGILRDLLFTLAFKMFRIRILVVFHGSDPIAVRSKIMLRLVAKILLSNVDFVGLLSTEEIRCFQEAFPSGRYIRVKFIENTIGIIRGTYPKKTKFDRVSIGTIKSHEQRFNNKPREILNY